MLTQWDANGYSQSDNVLVEARGQGDFNTWVASLQRLGFQITLSEPTDHMVDGYLPVANVVAASMGQTISIVPVSQPITNSIGLASDQAEVSMNAGLARQLFNINDAGITVGVISNGASAASIASAEASGDLPSAHGQMQILNAGSGDEGTAMMQEIYDMLSTPTDPSAVKFAFDAGGGTDASLANAINQLVAAGCQIIVDDMSGLGSESFFQDGLAAQAIDAAAAHGVSYFTSAGNQGSSGYETPFRGVTTTVAGITGLWQNFDSSGGIDPTQLVTINPGTTQFVFQFNDPWYGGTGVTHNVNLYLLNSTGTTVLAQGMDNTILTDVPQQIVTFDNTTGGPMQVLLAVQVLSGGDIGRFKYVGINEGPTPGITIDNHLNETGAIVDGADSGHAGAAGAIDVAASPVTDPTSPESFTGLGPVTRVFDTSGDRLPTVEVLDKPDLTASDGVSTTVPGENPFYGTSASAANAAAVAALLLGYQHNLTPAQIRAALLAGTVDIYTPGYDLTTGAGLLDATGALLSLTNGKLTIQGDHDSAKENDQVILSLDDSNNTLLDVTLNGVFLGSVHLQFVQQIEVDGLGGNNQLTLDFSNGAITTPNGIIFNGGTGNNTLELDGTLSASWNITGANSGTVNGPIAFTAVANLIGSNGNNDFTFGNNGSVSGNITGKGSNNILDYYPVQKPVTANLATGVASLVGGLVNGIQVVLGAASPAPPPPAGVWTALTNPVPAADGGQMGMLLPNGSVLVHGGAGFASNAWYELTPNASGSYINGTWTTLNPMSTDRLYFGSAVLPDGNVFVVGGEYSGPLTTQNFINTDELYDPATNTWTTETVFPQAQYGDDPVEVLPNGTVLAGYLGGPQTYIFDPTANTWTATGTKLYGDQTDEEALVKLPDNSIADYDIWSSLTSAPGPGQGQRYIPATGTWVATGSVPDVLSDNTSGELGPGLLLPDGSVFITGTTGDSAIYYPPTYSVAALQNTWVAGPTLPTDAVFGPLGAANAPGAMLPNGDVLMALGPVNPGGTAGNFNAPTDIYEYDPTTSTFTAVTPLDPNLTGSAPYITTMLDLPTGQVMMFDDSGTPWIYTPAGAPQAAWLPTVSNIVNNGGGTYTLSGTQLNGMSEGANYGDENNMASNYPILQLISQPGGPATAVVSYANTFNWSSTGVQTGATPETVQFTLPAADPPGAYLASVTPNGLASSPFLWIDMGAGGNNITLELDAVTPNTVDVLSAGVLIDQFALNQFSSILATGDPVGPDNLTINDTVGGTLTVPILFEGSTGNNTLTVQSTAPNVNVWNLTGTDSGNVNGNIVYTNVQNLMGGPGVDDFKMYTAGSLTGTLTGGTGQEWLDYSNFASNITVNLAAGTAPNLNSVVNVGNVLGSAGGGDTLIGGALGGALVAHGVNSGGVFTTNTLIAGVGASILIGGMGQDTLIGNTGSDLIINGSTSYDYNIQALAMMETVWQSGASFATRMSNLSSTLVVGATVQLNPAATVIRGFRYFNGTTGTSSTLVGGSSNNWFFTASTQTITNFNGNDVVTL